MNAREIEQLDVLYHTLTSSTSESVWVSIRDVSGFGFGRCNRLIIDIGIH